MNNCPWCDIETKCNASFFPITGPKSSTDLNITSLWQQFLSIKAPTSIHPLPDATNSQASPSSAAIQIGKKLRKNQYRFALLLLGNWGWLLWNNRFSCTYYWTDWPSVLFLLHFFLLYNGRKKKLIEAISQEFGLVKPQWVSLPST